MAGLVNAAYGRSLSNRGAVQLAELGAVMKAMGAGGARLHMIRGLKAVAAPSIPAVKAAAVAQLPHSGGLNLQVAGQKVSTSVRLGARNPSVRISTTAPDTSMTDAGFVRHPTFGRRGKGQWKTQQIPNAAGWWSVTLSARQIPATAEMLKVQAQIARLIQGGRL